MRRPKWRVSERKQDARRTKIHRGEEKRTTACTVRQKGATMPLSFTPDRGAATQRNTTQDNARCIAWCSYLRQRSNYILKPGSWLDSIFPSSKIFHSISLHRAYYEKRVFSIIYRTLQIGPTNLSTCTVCFAPLAHRRACGVLRHAAAGCGENDATSRTAPRSVWTRYFILRNATYGRPPYVIRQAIIFLPCGFFLSSIFFSSPYLSVRRLDVYHTSTHGVALARIQKACLKCAARGSLKIQNAKIAILAPSDNFVGLYLRSWGIYRQSEKRC